MPVRPTNVGGAPPTSEIPVTGGSLMGKISNMPMEMAQAPGGMFGGKGTAGSPTSPQPGGSPQQIQMPGANQPAQPIFGQSGGGGGQQSDFLLMLQQILQGGGGM